MAQPFGVPESVTRDLEGPTVVPELQVGACQRVGQRHVIPQQWCPRRPVRLESGQCALGPAGQQVDLGQRHVPWGSSQHGAEFAHVQNVTGNRRPDVSRDLDGQRGSPRLHPDPVQFHGEHQRLS